MIYVLRREASDGARLLTEGLEGLRLRRVENGRFYQRTAGGNGFRARRGDVVVCWGDTISAEIMAQYPGVRFLNAAAIGNKLEQAQRIAAANVPTIEVSATIRANTPARAAIPAGPEVPATFDMDTAVRAVNGRTAGLTKAEVRRYIEEFSRFLATPDRPATPAQPAQPATTWLGRRFNHIGGRDLLNPPDNPDYWVKKENLRAEYRLHMFNGKSIRAGKKVAREGQASHAWIRSDEAGWFVRYDDFHSQERMREVAAAAVNALGLQFGAVDLGLKEDGHFIVLEVNRAPGLGEGTVTSYANAIQAWADGEQEERRAA